jgi:hypothetical protein
MKTSLELTLAGKDWWKPFLPFWVVYVAYVAITRDAAKSGLAISRPGGYLFLVLGLLFAAMAIFTIMFLRAALPKLRAGDKGFEFGATSENTWGLCSSAPSCPPSPSASIFPGSSAG